MTRRTAIVHDWLTGMRGGEKVLELLCELLPGSDLYTMIHRPGKISPRIEAHRITASWLDRLPGSRRRYRYLLPLMPAAARAMKLRGYDLVVAVSTCVAHGVDVEPGARFICYCNTPMRYAWKTLDDYVPKTLRQRVEVLGLRALGPFLRSWDRRAAHRVGEYVANSLNVRERIRRCYGRDARVIHPPVDTDFYRPLKTPRGDYYLWAGALVPYKRIDLAIEGFRMLGRRLLVVGEGQNLRWAKAHAPANVEFLGRRSDEELRRLYASCRALVFPGVEDFGIVPVEAQACGRPVVARAAGGALETVVGLDSSASSREPTGLFFEEPTPEALANAVLRFERAASSFRPAALRENALRFSRERCRGALASLLFTGRERDMPCPKALPVRAA